MKKYGHTGTLFLQNGKYYKWSYKFDNCQNCGTCNFKHKGRGLCTSCWDKERLEKYRTRKVSVYITQCRFGYRKRIKKYLTQKEKKKGGSIPVSKEQREIKKKEWYKNNRERLNLQGKAQKMIGRGEKCISVIFGSKTVHLPFASFMEKPIAGVVNGKPTKEYSKYKEQLRQFDVIRKFYSK